MPSDDDLQVLLFLWLGTVYKKVSNIFLITQRECTRQRERERERDRERGEEREREKERGRER